MENNNEPLNPLTDSLHCLEKDFEAKKENVPKMPGMIGDFSDEHGLPMDFSTKLVIVGDELISNIIKHGYEEGEGIIKLRLLFDGDTRDFTIVVIDKAKPFNQLGVENPDIGTAETLNRIGGLGIHIVKKIMDECSYERKEDMNILTLKKKF